MDIFSDDAREGSHSSGNGQSWQSYLLNTDKKLKINKC